MAPKVAAWRRALAARASIRDAVVRDYPDRLRRYVLELDSELGRIIGRRSALLPVEAE